MQGLLATCLVVLVLVVAPAALVVSDVGDPDEGTWSWVEAEYRMEEDDAIISMPAGTRPDNVFSRPGRAPGVSSRSACTRHNRRKV